MDEPVDSDLELTSVFTGVTGDTRWLECILAIGDARGIEALEGQAIVTAGYDQTPAYLRSVREYEERIAKERAESLLMAHLTPKQQALWKRSGYVLVEVANPDSPSYDGLYYIHRVYKTDRFVNGRRTHTYCLQAARYDLDYHYLGAVPDVDTVLAEMLLLRFNPAAYHAQANVLWSAEIEERMFGTAFHDAVQALENVPETLANFGRAMAEIFSDFATVVQTLTCVIPPGRTWPDLNVLAEERNRGQMEVYRGGRGPPAPIIHLETPWTDETIDRLRARIERG